MKDSFRRLAEETHGYFYLLFPNLFSFIYRALYMTAFKNAAIYLDKPPSLFKHIEIGEHSSSSGIIKVITFTPFHTMIKIGKYVRTGENCYFMLNTRHTKEFVSNHMNNLFVNKRDKKLTALYESKITSKNASLEIGNDVWIGTDVKIIGSRKIGDGAVIAAGAIVTHDVNPYEIVGGIPARHIGYRFPKKIRERLLKTKWWNWDDEKIRKNISEFYEVNSFSKKSW